MKQALFPKWKAENAECFAVMINVILGNTALSTENFAALALFCSAAPYEQAIFYFVVAFIDNFSSELNFDDCGDIYFVFYLL